MSRNPLFSTYRQGENRVTSSMLAVFERIDIAIVEALLTAVSGEASLPFVSFVNQVPGPAQSVPDAEISSNFRYLFEVKTTPNALTERQLTEHLKHFDGLHSNERLFVVTPDAARPALIDQIGDPRLSWFSFASLDQAIGELQVDAALGDSSVPLSEQTHFLLRELRALFAIDGLLEHNDVLVVAARTAYPDYLRHSAYLCQPDRTFQPVARIAFYADQAIQIEVPRILVRRPNVTFTRSEAARLLGSTDEGDRAIGEHIVYRLDSKASPEGTTNEVFLLSAPDHRGTLRLSRPIRNTKRDRNGRPAPWTYGQRYTRSDLLKREFATTEELDEATAR
jgi:hypothetical protein